MKSIRIEDDDEEDCRILHGGAFYQRIILRHISDANCLIHEHRPQFGFRLIRDVAGGTHEHEKHSDRD